MKVCKFGGSSLADAAQLNKVIDIVLADPARKIVVVSAPGKRNSGDTKVTDLLIALAKAALNGENTDAPLKAVVDRYAEIAADLKLGDEIVRKIEDDLKGRLAQVKTLKPEEFMDLLKAAGEDNNAKLVAVAFEGRGKRARYASPKDTGMVLEGKFGDATLNPESYARLAKAFSNFEGIVIYPGFFGYTKDGKVATFPRGGSDITGSILAAAVRADVYENFTDVDSVYPCDPRIVEEVKDGEGIPTMTYREMRELAYAGFGVFNDDAVIPAVKARIPINIRNTNDPEAAGTLIVESTCQKPDYTITGIAGKKGFVAVSIDKDMMNAEVGFCRKALQAFEENGISIEHMPSGIDTMTVFVHQEEFEGKEQQVISSLRRLTHPDVIDLEADLGLIAVVGRGMKSTRGTAGRIFSALAHANINVKMIDQGSSELNIIIGVSNDDFDDAIHAIYDIFVETRL